MKGISSRSKRSECFCRYLKPGALAQLRDSKISARSHKPSCLTGFITHQVDPHHQISSMVDVDQIPYFLMGTKIYGPQCLKRKKLVAARPVFFLNLGPSTPVLEANDVNVNNSDSLIGILSNDVLVAH